MKKLILIVLLLFTACSSKDSSIAQKHYRSYMQHYTLIIKAEKRASYAAQKVMRTARGMVERGEIIRGGCWDYLDAAFTRAGYPRNARKRIYTSTKRGAYAHADILQPGDWIYHVNHSYRGIEHSGMFIEWIDYSSRTALMLSYAGERRQEPARYKVYDLSSVYRIMRVE